VVWASLTTGCAGLFGTNPSDVRDYDVEIWIRNNHDETHTVDIEIAEFSGSVHKTISHAVAPNSEETVSPFTDLRGTDRAQFRVTFTVDDYEPLERTAEMNACFGALELTIREDGSLSAGPIVC